MLLARRRQVDSVGLHLERAEQPELHLAPIVALIACRHKPGVSGPVNTCPAVEERRNVPVPELSLTEERIVRLLSEGLSNGEIAKAVGLDERTVDWHLERAGRKLERAAVLHKRVKGRQQ